MQARPIEPAEVPAYETLAERYGTLFVRRDWTQLFGGSLLRCGLFDSGGGLCGGFQLFVERRFGLTVVRDAPFTPECGPFVKIDAEHPVSVLQARRKALTAQAEFLRDLRPALVFLSLPRDVTDLLPFIWKGFKVIPAYTYVLDLRRSMDQIVAGFTAKRRNDVSRAIRDGLKTRRIEDYSGMERGVSAMFERKKKKPYRMFLEQILRVYPTDHNSFAFGSFRGEECLATCFVIHDHKTAYYLLGNRAEDGAHHGAGALALQESIRHAQKIGCEWFDFEGSVIRPIERFFRGFGGELTPYFTVNRGWLPVEILLKFSHRSTF